MCLVAWVRKKAAGWQLTDRGQHITDGSRQSIDESSCRSIGALA